MAPLTQCQLNESLAAFFDWINFRCPDMPVVNSYFCHSTVPGIIFTEPSMTKQSYKEEADINNIVNQYHRTGLLPQGTRQPMFGDFSSGDDFAESLIRIQEAQADFDALPSAIRTEFGNDPAQLLSFMQDPENLEEAIEMGLYPAPEKEPVPAAAEPEKTPPAKAEPEA